MTKQCNICTEVKELTEFQAYRGRGGKTRHSPMCKPCRSIKRRGDTEERRRGREARRAKYATPEGREEILNKQFKWRYGITPEERDALLAAQGGACAICGSTDSGPREWCTDHDHSCCPGIKSCGKCIRGLLCTRCNCGLGQFRDDVEFLISAASYLLSHQDLLMAGLSSAGKPNLSAAVSRRMPV